MIVIRPGIKMHRRMDEMLDGVERDRTPRSGNVEQPFDSQDLPSMPVNQKRQPDDEGRPVDRLANLQGETDD